MRVGVEAMALPPPLTLSGGLEIERLETPGERRGVDDVHAVLAVVLPVQHDGHHEDCHGDDPGSQAGVQRHVVGAVHTWRTQETDRGQVPFQWVRSHDLSSHMTRMCDVEICLLEMSKE